MSEAAGTGNASQARLFNSETMSGVYPGTRTQIFQRVRLRAAKPGDAPGDEPAVAWAQILWYSEPAAAVVALQPSGEGDNRAAAPLLRLEGAPNAETCLQLAQGLAAAGWQPATCGSCALWRQGEAATEDGLPLGACTLGRAEAGEVPAALAVQSSLALDCPHWRNAREAPASPLAADAPPVLPTAPLPKAAETSDSKKPLLTRWMLGARRALQPPVPPPPPLEALLERSGVGAGTEPCFACQGRIANLGALAVESPEGDKQTFSVWRCRLCFTLYLSDWIDRWERVDSLETEETIYRIAPAEAADLLTIIVGVSGGDHPGRRRERTAQRAWVLEQLEQRPVLSHLIKLGR